MNENKSEKTALLVMDVQPGILGRLENKDEYLAKVVKAVDFAHEKGIPVIYVVVGFRPGMPEVSLRNKSFGAIASMAASALSKSANERTNVTSSGDFKKTRRRLPW